MLERRRLRNLHLLSAPNSKEKLASLEARTARSASRINKAGCFSQCGHGPMIVFYPEDVWYAGVQEEDLDGIFTSHILGGRPVERLRYARREQGE